MSFSCATLTTARAPQHILPAFLNLNGIWKQYEFHPLKDSIPDEVFNQNGHDESKTFRILKVEKPVDDLSSDYETHSSDDLDDMKNTFAEKYINNETKRIEKRPSLMRRIKNKATDAVNRVKKSAKGPCFTSKIWRILLSICL